MLTTLRGTRHNYLIANHRAVDWPRIHGCDHTTIGAREGPKLVDTDPRKTKGQPTEVGGVCRCLSVTKDMLRSPELQEQP